MCLLLPTEMREILGKTYCEGDTDTKTRNSLWNKSENFLPMSEVSLPCLTQQQVGAKNCLVHKKLTE